MSDKVIQIEMPSPDDRRPLPLRIAEAFRFKLAFHPVDATEFYAVQDWIGGIVPKANVRKHWNMIKSRYPQFSTRCRQLPYVTRDGKTYQTDHADAETLYSITQYMEAQSGNRDAVLDYLAQAGVRLDELIRDPDKAEALFAELADRHEYNRALQEGLSPSEAIQWVNARRQLKQEQGKIQFEWSERGISEWFEFARLNNDLSVAATGKTATRLKREMNIKGTPRDYQSAAENVAMTFTCITSRMLHTENDSQGVDELSGDIKEVKPAIDAARPELEKIFSKKRRRLPPQNPA